MGKPSSSFHLFHGLKFFFLSWESMKWNKMMQCVEYGIQSDPEISPEPHGKHEDSGFGAGILESFHRIKQRVLWQTHIFQSILTEGTKGQI